MPKPDLLPAVGESSLPTPLPREDRRPPVTRAGAMMMRSVEDIEWAANTMVRAKFTPYGMSKEAACVAIMFGGEVGLSPVQAVQSIAIIKGRPCLWGDALPGLIHASGLLEDEEEVVAGEGQARACTCTVKRKGIPTPFVRSFSMADAARAGLLGPKATTWKEYPDRMLTMRARSWAYRDAFADVLRGLQIREEVNDLAEGQAPPGVTSDPLGAASPGDGGEGGGGDEAEAPAPFNEHGTFKMMLEGYEPHADPDRSEAESLREEIETALARRALTDPQARALNARLNEKIGGAE